MPVGNHEAAPEGADPEVGLRGAEGKHFGDIISPDPPCDASFSVANPEQSDKKPSPTVEKEPATPDPAQNADACLQTSNNYVSTRGAPMNSGGKDLVL